MSAKFLEFIQTCVKERKIVWTYHVNMRLKGRFIPREFILNSVNSYEVIEEYSQDKYLPSYLVYARYENEAFHILFAPDVKNDRVSIITTYKPDPVKWEKDLKTRRES